MPCPGTPGPQRCSSPEHGRMYLSTTNPVFNKEKSHQFTVSLCLPPLELLLCNPGHNLTRSLPYRPSVVCVQRPCAVAPSRRVCTLPSAATGRTRWGCWQVACSTCLVALPFQGLFDLSPKQRFFFPSISGRRTPSLRFSFPNSHTIRFLVFGPSAPFIRLLRLTSRSKTSTACLSA